MARKKEEATVTAEEMNEIAMTLTPPTKQMDAESPGDDMYWNAEFQAYTRTKPETVMTSEQEDGEPTPAGATKKRQSRAGVDVTWTLHGSGIANAKRTSSRRFEGVEYLRNATGQTIQEYLAIESTDKADLQWDVRDGYACVIDSEGVHRCSEIASKIGTQRLACATDTEC